MAEALLRLEADQEVGQRQAKEVCSMAVVQLGEGQVQAAVEDAAPGEAQGRQQAGLFLSISKMTNLHIKLLKHRNTKQVIFRSRWPRRKRVYDALFARRITLRISVHYCVPTNRLQLFAG